MNEELAKLIEEARSQGATDAQLQQIAEAYVKNNADKFEKVEQPTPEKKNEFSKSTATPPKSVSEAQDTGGISESSDTDAGVATLDLSKEQDTPIDTSDIENPALKEILTTIDNTKLGNERISQLRKEIDEKYETSQGFIGKSLEFLGKVARPLTAYMTPESIEEAPGNLYREIETAKQQLAKENVDSKDPEYNTKVLERAKDIKLLELVTKERDAKVREYLSNLPEEKREEALQYSNNKMIALNSELTNGLFSMKMYEKDLNENLENITKIEEEAALLKSRQQEIIQDVESGVDDEQKKVLQTQWDNINNRLAELDVVYKSTLEEYNAGVGELNFVREKHLELVDQHSDFTEQVDYLKRSYGFLENAGSKFENTALTIGANVYDLLAYKEELMGSENVRERLKEKSEGLREVVLRSQESMEKPYSIKDVTSVIDFLKYSGNTLVEQSPYLFIGGAGKAAPFLFAVNASGAKAGQIDAMKFKEISPVEKATSIAWSGIAEGTLSSLGTIRNVRKAKKAFESIGRVGRKGGYKKMISDVGEGIRGEMFEELSVELLDATNNYVMLGDEQSFQRFNDSFADIAFSSGLFGGMTRLAPHVTGIIHSVFSSAAQRVQVKQYQKKINGLVNIINNPNLPKEDVEQAKVKLAETLDESQEYINENLKRLNFLSKTNKKRVGEIYFKVNQLAEKANKVKADPNITAEDKKTLLDGYKSETKKLIAEKEDIISKIEVSTKNKTQQDVSELFESNPELANAVYGALGFNNQKNKLVKSIIDAYSTGKPVNLPIDLLDRIKEFDRSTINDTINNIGRTRIDNLKENIKKEGLKNPLELTLNSKGNILLTEGNHRLIALLELGYKEVPVIIKERSELLKNILKEKAEQEYYYRNNEKLGLNLNIDFNNQITPKQKQQAISKFQEYINTTGKQDIEGFKKFVDRGNIKEGVSELFDSNPELANQVYEALGFKQKQYASKLKEISEKRKEAVNALRVLEEEAQIEKDRKEEIKKERQKAKKKKEKLSQERIDEINEKYEAKKEEIKENADKARETLKKTPKKLKESAENQKLREDVENKVLDELEKDKSEEEILPMFEGKEKEIAKDVIARIEPQTEESRANKFQKMLDKAEKDRAKMAKSKFSFRNIIKGFKEKFIDRTAFAKDIFKKAKLKVYNTSLIDYIVADGGSSGRAAEIFKDVYKKVYYKLTNADVSILDGIIQAKRLIALETQRKEQDKSDVITSGFVSSADAKSYLNKLKEKIGEKKFNDLNDRAEEFFSYYNNMLKEMYDEGFIDQDMYDAFKGYDYVQRKFLQHIEDLDGNFDYSRAADQSSLAQSPIKTITQGSSESMITDSMLLISMYINARSKSVSANRLNKATHTALVDAKKRRDALLAKEKAETISKKELRDLKALNKLFENINLDSKTPEEYRKVFFYENGQRKHFNMKPDFYDAYAGQLNGIISTPNMREALALVSGKAVLQSFATGNNPSFFITNTPRDASFIAVFGSQYSNFLLKALGQIGKDLVSGIREIRKGRESSYIYKNAVDYGLMMNFLHTQGRVKRNTFVDKLNKEVFDNIFKVMTLGLADTKRARDFVLMNKVFEFIGDLQEYGEIGFRVGVFTRTLRNEINNLKKEDPKKYEGIEKIEDLEKLDKGLRESIFTKAVAEARGKAAPDFNQSGTILKDIDAVVPYLNAATQSVRVAAEQFEERPLPTFMRVTQAAAIFSSVPIGLSVLLLGNLKDEELPEEYKGLTGAERWLKAYQKQSVYQNSNYMHIYYGISKEGEFKSFRIAKSHDITPVLSLAENIIANKMAEKYSVEDYQDRTIENMKFTMEKNILPFDLSLTGNLTRIPTVNSMLTYTLGYDFYRDQPLSYMQGYVPEEAEGFESDYIEPFYKEIGTTLVESPARLKGAVEAVVTSPRTNPYISFTYGAADALIGGEEGRRKSEILSNVKKMFVGRLFAKTSKYSSSVKLTKEQEIELAKRAQEEAVMDYNFKKVIDNYRKGEAIPKDIIEEIRLQSGKSPEETEKLVNKLIRRIEKSNQPYIVQKMKNMKPLGRAMMMYNIFKDDINKKENKEIKNQLLKAGVINSETLKEYKSIINGKHDYEYLKNNLNR